MPKLTETVDLSIDMSNPAIAAALCTSKEMEYLSKHPCACGGNWKRSSGGSSYPSYVYSECICNKCGVEKYFQFNLVDHNIAPIIKTTDFYNACMERDFKKAESLIASGNFINDSYGNINILRDAVLRNMPDVVTFFLTHCANPDTTGEVLLAAIYRKQSQIVEALVNVGGKVSNIDNLNTALLNFAFEGDDAMVKTIVKLGADINVIDGTAVRFQSGYTPLMCAIRKGHLSTVKMLVQLGANQNISGYCGNQQVHNAIDLANYTHQYDIEAYLKSLNPSKSSTQGCFIATAVYGSPFTPEVVMLKAFRDIILNRYVLGKFIIKNYYKISPNIAKQLSKHNSLCFLVKLIIDTCFIFPLKLLWK
jgi:ankyrin repeat protein